jgi:signal transduction histidine kinase
MLGLRGVRILAVGLICLFAFGVQAEEKKPTAEEVKALTLKAAQVVADRGIDEARAAFNKDGEFKYGEIYVNVIDTKGTWLAYPPKPDAVGKVVINVQDADGKFIVKDVIKLAAENGEGWTEYRWRNPANNQIQPKQTYVKQVSGTDYVVYIGVYK